MSTKQDYRDLRQTLEQIEELNKAEVKAAEADGYSRGFNQAMQLFRQERKEIFKFATLAAVSNAREGADVKLLTALSKNLTDATNEDINDRVTYRSTY